MNFLGNLIWLIFGGFVAAVGYFIGGCILCITLVGIPWGVQCFKLAEMVLWPFGKKIIVEPAERGCLNDLANFVWFVCGGWYTALTHLLMGALLYISLIGIPWGRQHFKLIEISLMPFGKKVVPDGFDRFH